MKNEVSNDTRATFDADNLEALTARMKAVVDIRDRKYGIPPKTYPKCFVGSEAVRKMVAEGIAGDDEDAIRIGNDHYQHMKLCVQECDGRPGYIFSVDTHDNIPLSSSGAEAEELMQLKRYNQQVASAIEREWEHFITANVRAPGPVLNDLRSMIAANNVGSEIGGIRHEVRSLQ